MTVEIEVEALDLKEYGVTEGMGDVEEKRRRERGGDGGEWSRGGGKSRCHRSGLNGDDLFASLGYGMFKVLLLTVASASL